MAGKPIPRRKASPEAWNFADISQSAGQTIKMVAYGVALPGLIASGCIFAHVGSTRALVLASTNHIMQVSGKYIFVRILRNSDHLQKGTLVHWSVWLGSVAFIVILAFIFAEVIPIFNSIIALTGSVCFAPLNMILPGWLWLYDHGHYRRGGLGRMILYGLHWGMILVGFLFLVGATYGVVLGINQTYHSGGVGR